MTHFMPRSYITISDTVDFGIPRAASRSHTVSHQSLLIAAHTRSTFSCVLLVAGLPEHGSLSTDSQPSLQHLCHTFICDAFIALSLKAFWIIRVVSMEECSSLSQNLLQIRCFTCSVILTAMAAQYTRSLSGVYHPTLTSTVKVSLFTHVHSSPFSLGPGYIDVTVPIILIMAGHFLDRLYVCVCVYIYVCVCMCVYISIHLHMDSMWHIQERE